MKNIDDDEKDEELKQQLLPQNLCEMTKESARGLDLSVSLLLRRLLKL